jgi:transposase-like protein
MLVRNDSRLELRVPRDRDGAFSSAIVPAHERMEPRPLQDLARIAPETPPAWA